MAPGPHSGIQRSGNTIACSHSKATAYPTIRSMLHNHRRVEQWWNLEDVDSLPCCCYWIRTHSSCEFTDSEHLAVALEDLDLPSQLISFKSANANSTYFYSRQPFYDQFSSRVTSWTQQHGLPPFTDTELWRFFNQQWKSHAREIRRTDRFSFQKIKHLQQWLHHSAVLHHADHEQAKLTVFCPRLYFRGAWNTWDDQQLFHRLSITPEDAQERINTSLPRALQIKYKWAINKKSNLPYGFVFLKKKKTVSERENFDFILQQSIWSPFTSHSPNAGLDVTAVMASGHGPVSGSSDLVTHPYIFQRHLDGIHFGQHQ